MAKRKKAKPPSPTSPPTGSEPRRSLEEIERALRESEIVSMQPLGGNPHGMSAARKMKPQPNKYLELVRALPRPSLEQTYRFAWFVAEAHSWYKKLPTDRTVPFVFYLNPCAGWSTTYFANGKIAVEEITDESSFCHYTSQMTADYHRRFGHWDYDVDTPGEGASVWDGEGNFIAVPRPFLEAGRADVNAFMHGNTLHSFWRPEPGEEPPKFLGDPAAAAFGKERGPADRLAKPFQSAVDERLRQASADPERLEFSWFGAPWFDESWEEAFAAMGGTSTELAAALSSFQRRLLLTNAAAISGEEVSGEAVAGRKRQRSTAARRGSGKAVTDIPVAFAYERNRQLDEMRLAMLRVLDLIDTLKR